MNAFFLVINVETINNMINEKVLASITRKAIFLSLFIAEKCLRRDMTAESRGLSEATVSSPIHGWPVSYKNQWNSGYTLIEKWAMNQNKQMIKLT